MGIERITTELRTRYQQLVRENSAAAEQGEYPPLNPDHGRSRLDGVLAIESQLVHPGEGPRLSISPEITELRRQVMAGELFDAMHTIEPVQLAQVLARVDDPILDAAFDWVESRGLANSTREAFTEKFDPKAYGVQRSLRAYKRPLVLLNLVQRHPEIIPKLEESSSFFPHRLFLHKQRSQRDLEAEITKEIAGEMPTIFPDALLAVLPRIAEFIANRFPKKTERRLGQYQIPEYNVHCAFTTADPTAAQTLDALYDHLETKRQVYHTLLTAFLITGHACRAQSGKSARAMRGVPFTVSPSRYRHAKQAIENFAMNQTYAAWKDHPDYVQPSLLAHRLGMKVRASDPTRLEISHGRNTDIFRPESNMYPTTVLLPFCVFLLHEQYRIARDVLAKAG